MLYVQRKPQLLGEYTAVVGAAATLDLNEKGYEDDLVACVDHVIGVQTTVENNIYKRHVAEGANHVGRTLDHRDAALPNMLLRTLKVMQGARLVIDREFRKNAVHNCFLRLQHKCNLIDPTLSDATYQKELKALEGAFHADVLQVLGDERLLPPILKDKAKQKVLLHLRSAAAVLRPAMGVETTSTLNGQEIKQIEKPITQLTAQQQEVLTSESDAAAKKPGGSQLPDILSNKLNQKIRDILKKHDNRALGSQMRHLGQARIPGLLNAFISIVTMKKIDTSEQRVISQSCRMATPVPTTKDEKTRDARCKQNLEQLVEAVKKEFPQTTHPELYDTEGNLMLNLAILNTRIQPKEEHMCTTPEKIAVREIQGASIGYNNLGVNAAGRLCPARHSARNKKGDSPNLKQIQRMRTIAWFMLLVPVVLVPALIITKVFKREEFTRFIKIVDEHQSGVKAVACASGRDRTGTEAMLSLREKVYAEFSAIEEAAGRPLETDASKEARAAEGYLSEEALGYLSEEALGHLSEEALKCLYAAPPRTERSDVEAHLVTTMHSAFVASLRDPGSPGVKFNSNVGGHLQGLCTKISDTNKDPPIGEPSKPDKFSVEPDTDDSTVRQDSTVDLDQRTSMPALNGAVARPAPHCADDPTVGSGQSTPSP